MKKFKYRLQALLKAREHIEKERQKQHAAALHQVYNQQQTLSRIAQDKQDTLSGQRRVMTGSVSVAELLVYTRHILKLKREILAGRELLNVLQKDEGEKRRFLLEASKERKIYEKLKERQQEQFNYAVEQHATKENDEAALNSFRLKKRTK
jgi:flagellar FliJ protein